MASSQVEIAVTSPFGCVLRKYNNHRQRGRFQKEVTNFVNDHLNNNNNTSGGGSVSSDDEKNSRNNPNPNDRNSERDEPSQWAARKAKEMVSTIETEAELLETLPNMEKPGPSTSSEISKASSLVQIWEKRLSKSNSNSVGSVSGESSPTSDCGPESACSTPRARSSNNNNNTEWDGNNNNNATESEISVRVADIIKKLKKEQQDHLVCNNNNNNNNSTMVGGSSCLSRGLRVGVPTATAEQGSENHAKNVVNVASSPRIRGRQAFNDLLMQIERDRHGELNNLSQRAVVSKFPQKGRIQGTSRLHGTASRVNEGTSGVNNGDHQRQNEGRRQDEGAGRQ